MKIVTKESAIEWLELQRDALERMAKRLICPREISEYEVNTINLIIDLIKDREPGEWISADITPDNNECVLVSNDREIEFGKYEGRGPDWYVWRDEHWDWTGSVDAWMPLPKPWQGEQDWYEGE